MTDAASAAASLKRKFGTSAITDELAAKRRAEPQTREGGAFPGATLKASTQSATALEKLRNEVRACVDAQVKVRPGAPIADLVVDYAFVLESLLAQVTEGSGETRRELDMWLGRFTCRSDSDDIECTPWFTGPGCGLVRVLVDRKWSAANTMRRPCDLYCDFRREWLDAKKDPEKDRHCLVEPSPVAIYDGAYIANHEHPRLGELMRQSACNDWFYYNALNPDGDVLVRYPRGLGISESPNLFQPPWTFASAIVKNHMRRIDLPGTCDTKDTVFMDTELDCYWIDVRDAYQKFVAEWAAQPSKKWWRHV
jgi:hypothetical protein